MTVSSIRPVNNYSGNGSNTVFDFDFLIEHQEELVVTYISESGISQELIYGIDYSINEIGNINGSYIVFPLEKSTYNILQDGEVISISLSLEIKQESEFENSANLNLKVLEWTFDYIIRLIQMLSSRIDRSLKVQEGTATTPDELISSLNSAQQNSYEYSQYSAQKSQEAADAAATAISKAEFILETVDDATANITQIANSINIPLVLFESKYSEVTLNNASWLRSEGQWNAKSIYPDAYNELLTQYSSPTRNLPIKKSTETYDDFDFVINITNETFRLPLKNGSENIISPIYSNVELKATGGKYIAPANGEYQISSLNASSMQFYNNTCNDYWVENSRNDENGTLSISCPAKKGDVCELYYILDGVRWFRFYYYKGNGNLYYYVGSVLQNAAMINAGALTEQITSIEARQANEIGRPIITLSSTLLDGEIWLEGATVSRTTYSNLYNLYGCTYGGGDGSTTFTLPDFRNRVLWGSDNYGYISAGLPNITGTIPIYHGNATGCFYFPVENTAINSNPVGSTNYYKHIGFNAAISSSIYGSSTTVQPPAIRVRVKTRYK